MRERVILSHIIVLRNPSCAGGRNKSVRRVVGDGEVVLVGKISSPLASIACHLCGPLPQVVVLTQQWGKEYYHILVENLSRITVVLDFLLENPDIKVSPVFRGLIFCHVSPCASSKSLVHNLPPDL